MLSWEMPSKNLFAYSTLIMRTLKGSTDRFFNFSVQSQNFTGGLNRPDLFPIRSKINVNKKS